jgi:hypothetical protein
MLSVVNTLPFGVRELGRDGAREAEAEGGHVAPAQEAAWDLRLVHRAALTFMNPSRSHAFSKSIRSYTGSPWR